jgi:hypothetical protein
MSPKHGFAGLDAVGSRHVRKGALPEKRVGVSSSATVVERERTLDRLLLPTDSVALDSGAGPGPPEWLTSGTWRLLARPRRGAVAGETIQSFEVASGERLAAVQTAADGRVWIPFDVDEAYSGYVTEAWRRSERVRALKPWQLNAYYRVKRLVPRSWQLRARRLLIRATGSPVFPAWPLDDSVDRLVRFYAGCVLRAAGAEEATFRWFWPQGQRAALILTHDVESAAGLRLAVDLADLEESYGVRSSFNVVAADYPVDPGILRELRDRGFEIGLHGLHHDRSLFSSRREFERQRPELAQAARTLGAEGFRSPATHRVVEWLPELGVSYDCSVPHSDPYEPQPGGCCTLWPFFLGQLVELPYTLPQDHTLFTLLGARSVEPWLSQVDAIEQRFGLAQCLSHPDPGYLGDPDKRALYEEFIAAMAERRDLWRALPRDVASWWRRRPTVDASDPELALGTMRRDGNETSIHPPNR